MKLNFLDMAPVAFRFKAGSNENGKFHLSHHCEHGAYFRVRSWGIMLRPNGDWAVYHYTDGVEMREYESKS